MIEVRRLYKQFAEKTVLEEVSLQFQRGETVFVLGRSGVGKSVLLKHIVGLIRPERGQVWVDGEDVTQMNEMGLTRIRKKCGMVFQFPALLDSLTLYENITFGLYAHNLVSDEKAVKERVASVLQLVNLKENILPRFPGELSFGTQKRAAIARTLAIEPEYLLFDEPTTGLDPITTRSINLLIQDLKERLGVGNIVVSHDLESALAIADRIILLDAGRAVFDGSCAGFGQSSHPLARAFLAEVTAC